MDQLFYELIQVALGTRICLSHLPSADVWGELYAMAKKQSLVGVCFAGVQKLVNQQQEPPEMLYLTWMGMAAKIQQKNETINRQCVEIVEQFRKDGLEVCVLKGQGVASYYDAGLRGLRQSGDIDLWVNGTWKDVMDYVNARTPNREFDDKHTHLETFDDTIVEVHWWPSVNSNPIISKRLKAYYREQVPLQCANKVKVNDDCEIFAPMAEFEAVHVYLHLYGHYLYEGVGLRQLMDLYFVLKHVQDKSHVVSALASFGAMKFAPAVMHILKNHFGLEEQYLLCAPNEAAGDKLLAEIMVGGNFGQHDKENLIMNESYAHRMFRRAKRKIRLIKYNPLGVLHAPIHKISLLLWMRKVIKMYNL